MKIIDSFQGFVSKKDFENIIFQEIIPPILSIR